MFSNYQSKSKLNHRDTNNGKSKLRNFRQTPSLQHSNSKTKTSMSKLNSAKQYKTHHKQQQPMPHTQGDHANNIHAEYYPQQSKNDRPRRAPDPEPDPRQPVDGGSHRDEESNCYSLPNSHSVGSLQGGLKIGNRVQLPNGQNVITFEGKVVKLPQHKSSKTSTSANNNYTIYLSFQQSREEDQLTSKKRAGSKEGISKKSGRKSEKNKEQRMDKHFQSKQYMSFETPAVRKFDQLMTHKPESGEETRVSPYRIQYSRNEHFDYEQIDELIEEDLKACALNEIRISKESAHRRKESLELLSELCAELELRRETFYLAISIFDRACSKKINIDNFKLLALVSLTLSMKLEQAALSQQFVHVLGVVNCERESYMGSISSCKSSSKQKNVRSSKKGSPSKGKRRWKPTHMSIKEEDICRISIGTVARLLKKYSCGKIMRKEFMELEEKVTLYLRFRMWKIQAIFWADLLTCMWDQHVLSMESASFCLLFRSSSNLSNIGYLYQMLEMSYLEANVYDFASIHLVLGVMYLLVRIARENHDIKVSQTPKEERGDETARMHQFYKESLASSTNILFVDSTGINQVYWLFLKKLKIEMVNVVECCQFVSQFLGLGVPSPMKEDPLRKSSDAGLCIHQYNPRIYGHP